MTGDNVVRLPLTEPAAAPERDELARVVPFRRAPFLVTTSVLMYPLAAAAVQRVLDALVQLQGG